MGGRKRQLARESMLCPVYMNVQKWSFSKAVNLQLTHVPHLNLAINRVEEVALCRLLLLLFYHCFSLFRVK